MIITKVYLTTGLFIIVSWISFIVPPEVVPGQSFIMIFIEMIVVLIFTLNKKEEIYLHQKNNMTIPGRMALLVTLFLVLVNIFNSVTGNAPKAEGLTAVETWVFFILVIDRNT